MAETMQLTSFQVAELKKLLTGEQPLARFCDSTEGEFLCRSGFVCVQPPKVGIRATVTITDRGRQELARHAA